MKHKLVSALFLVSFILTGCGIDSIFEGGFPFWMFCFLVTAISGYFVFLYERRVTTYGKYKWGYNDLQDG